MNYDTNFPSIKGEVSEAEWDARVELAACYRLVDRFAMTDLIYNHITGDAASVRDSRVAGDGTAAAIRSKPAHPSVRFLIQGTRNRGNEEQE